VTTVFIPDLDRVVPENSNLENIEFTPDNIYAAIRKLRISGAIGPDGFPPQTVQDISELLIRTVVTILFSSFISIGKVPQNWKHAVYKNGSASCVSNYRPISLICVACKLMERVIVNKTLNFRRANKVITKHQHGFLSGRSTTSNLLECISDWTL